MAKEKRETLTYKNKVDSGLIFQENSKTQEMRNDKLENISSSAAKMDFQIDPNNYQEALQIIEFAEHLKKIHKVVDITTDDQTLRIQDAINKNLNESNKVKVLAQKQPEAKLVPKVSDEQMQILEQMGVKIDHLLEIPDIETTIYSKENVE